MPQQPVLTCFLYVYDVESGLWVHTMLGSAVSPRIQEAMNLILLQDGILAFIGTRLEFGDYLSELSKDRGKDNPRCWTSLPAYTIMSMLGLCQNTRTFGRPELVFYGSPLTLMLAYLLDTSEKEGEEVIRRNDRFSFANGTWLELPVLESLGVSSRIFVTASEYEEARSYYEESNPHGPVLLQR